MLRQGVPFFAALVGKTGTVTLASRSERSLVAGPLASVHTATTSGRPLERVLVLAALGLEERLEQVDRRRDVVDVGGLGHGVEVAGRD